MKTLRTKLARKPRTKGWEKRNEPYAAVLIDLIEGLGAVKRVQGRLLARWALETQAGMLRLSVHANLAEPGAWVATQFDDVERAVQLLGKDDRLSHHSGKWNHHFFSVPIYDAARHLRRDLTNIMPYDVVVSNHGSIFLFDLRSKGAIDWVDEHVGKERTMYGGQLVVEHRYASDLAGGMREAGLRVS